MDSPSTLVEKIVELDNGDLQIDVVGVPFQSLTFLGGKDFDGEYFDKTTEIGIPGEGPLPKVFSYFHHGNTGVGLGDLTKKPIGSANYLGMNEEQGHLYRIIIGRANAYKKLIQKLYEEKVLRASSTPHQRGAHKDPANPSHWADWPVEEVTLTYAANNPDAEAIYQKSLGELMETSSETTDAAVTPVTTEQPPAKPDLVAEVEKALADPVVEDAAAESDSILTRLEKSLDGITARLAAIESGMKTVDAIALVLPPIAKEVKALQTAIAGKEKSAPEKAVEDQLRGRGTPAKPAHSRVNTKLPLDAPGNHD